jgi:hypothetical protein
MNDREFFEIYYGSEVIRNLIYDQLTTADYCVGSGVPLVDLGWSPQFPVHVIPCNSNPYSFTFQNSIYTVDQMMDLGLELFRPIREINDNVLFMTWDLEYYNRSDSYWHYREFGKNQRQIFQWMAPVYEILEEILQEYGVSYSIDVTASGIHVWSAVSTDSLTFASMADEGFLEPSLAHKYSQTPPGDVKRYKPVPAALGAAYNTAGKMLEFLTHELIRRADRLPLPVTISDSAQGGTSFPDSGISSDLTQYAHPIYMRVMRLIGSSHQKVKSPFPDAQPAIDIYKLPQMSYNDVLEMMWDPCAAIDLYSQIQPVIPVSDNGWGNVFADYVHSDLREWHHEFEYGDPHEYNYRFMDHPPCIQTNIFRNVGKDALLTPTNLQLVAEYMYSVGENLTKIAKGIGDAYSDPSWGWFDRNVHSGIDWNKYDPYQAANFWMRIYSGLQMAGLGRGIDCTTIQQAGVCPLPMCGIDISEYVN